MSQFGVPEKFVGIGGAVNTAALAQSLQSLGGDPSAFISGTTVNVDGMAGAYRALEGAAAAAAAKPAEGAPAVAAAGPASELQTATGLTAADLDWNAATAEILANGDLSAARREAFKAAGVPDAAINQQVSGIKAQKEVATLRAQAAVGGKVEYDNFINWANANMPVEQRQGLQAQMLQPGGELALQGAFAQYKAANPAVAVQQGGEPQLFDTTGAGGGPAAIPGDLANTPFTDRTERNAAFKDRRYQSDLVFRQMVESRARATSAHVRALNAPTLG